MTPYYSDDLVTIYLPRIAGSARMTDPKPIDAPDAPDDSAVDVPNDPVPDPIPDPTPEQHAEMDRRVAASKAEMRGETNPDSETAAGTDATEERT